MKTLLRHIFDAQNKRCFYCYAPLIFKSNALKNRSDGKLPYTRDHFIPKALDGENNRTNIVLACTECNNKKGKRLPNMREKMKFIKVHEKAFQIHKEYVERMRNKKKRHKK